MVQRQCCADNAVAEMPIVTRYASLPGVLLVADS